MIGYGGEGSLFDLRCGNKLYEFYFIMFNLNLVIMIFKLKIGRCMGDVKFLFYNNNFVL